MKKLLFTLVCLLGGTQGLLAEKFIATINELPAYNFDTGRGMHTNTIPDILSPEHHGYIVPTGVESIIEADVTPIHGKDVVFLFDNEMVNQGRWKFEYTFVFGGWGGDEHNYRFADNDDAWGRNQYNHYIGNEKSTYRVHNNVPGVDFAGWQFHDGSFRMLMYNTWAFARSKKARVDLPELPYLSFSNWSGHVYFHTARFMSFIKPTTEQGQIIEI